MTIHGTGDNPLAGKLYWTDASRTDHEARVLGHDGADGVVVGASIFYPGGGGQPADVGALVSERGRAGVLAAEEQPDGTTVIRVAGPLDLFPIGTSAVQEVDRDARRRHMRVHTALHLLTVVLPFPVTGGQISAEKGRLDFKMPAAPEDRAAIEERLNALVSRDLAVSTEWVTGEVFADHTDLVKTRAVQPPVIGGYVRLVRIGSGDETVDLQPCGGTHVARTGEIGTVRLGKVENKGRDNRRVTISVE